MKALAFMDLFSNHHIAVFVFYIAVNYELIAARIHFFEILWQVPSSMSMSMPHLMSLPVPPPISLPLKMVLCYETKS